MGPFIVFDTHKTNTIIEAREGHLHSHPRETIGIDGIAQIRHQKSSRMLGIKNGPFCPLQSRGNPFKTEPETSAR